MSAESTPQKRNWFKTILKTILVIGLLVIFSLTILANVGGSGEGYRDAVEEFLSEFSGYPVNVTTLNDMSFYPNVSFDFEGVEFLEAPNSEIVVAKIDRVVVSLGFWDMAFQTGKFNALHIETLRARPGVVLEKAVFVERFSIEQSADSQAAPMLSGTGTIDGVVTKIEMDVQPHGEPHAQSYSFGAQRNFTVTMGDAKLTGLARDVDDGLAVNDLALSFQGASVFSGDMNFKERVSGAIKITEHGSLLVPDFEVRTESKPLQISGNLMSACFYAADFTPESRLSRALDYIDDVIFEKTADGQGGRLSLSRLGLKFGDESFCNPDLEAEGLTMPFDLNRAKEISIEERP